MNINARKPLHNYSNTSVYSNEDHSQEIQDDSNGNEEIQSSESDFFEEDDSTNNGDEYRTRKVFELSRSVPRTPQRPRARAATRSPSISNYASKSKVESEQTSSLPLIAIIVVIISAIIAGVFSLISNDNQKYCHYDELQKQYPQQDQTLWRTLKVGVELILNRRTHSPAVYLFAHQGGPHVFQLVKDIASQSSKCFGMS